MMENHKGKLIMKAKQVTWSIMMKKSLKFRTREAINLNFVLTAGGCL